MGMTREELLLMTDLMRVCRRANTFYLEFTDEALPIETEEAYALNAFTPPASAYTTLNSRALPGRPGGTRQARLRLGCVVVTGRQASRMYAARADPAMAPP
jgi:hypothetical protein